MFYIHSVIPLAAEDHLLQWLDSIFTHISKAGAWSNWLDLLRLVYSPLTVGKVESNQDESNLVDVDIFDDSEPNTFDETIYTSYKCYTFLMKQIEKSTLTDAEKEQIFIELASLRNI